MHIICNKENLVKGIRIIETAVSTKATLPILSNFLFEVENKKSPEGKVKMVSTDLEIGIRCYVDAKIESGGGCTIPAKRFGSLIHELRKDNPIEIEIDKESHIDIKSGKSHFVLMGTPKEDYPALPEFIDEKAYITDKKNLHDMVKKTIFAVSTEETRYNLNGVYFIVEGKQLKLVATDGRRLAYTFKETMLDEINVKHKDDIIRGIVPTKTINELIKIISLVEPLSEKKMKFSITENQIAFQISDVTLISRLVEGAFPNYEQVIPKKNNVHIEVNAQELLSATRQMALVTAEKGGAIKFSFSKSHSGGLKLSAVSQGIGSGEVDIDVDFEGPNLETAFNPDYIIDILRNIDKDKVLFELSGSIDAAILKPAGNKNYICVVMPMRLT